MQKTLLTCVLSLLTVMTTNCNALNTSIPALQKVSVTSIKAGVGPITIDLYGSNFDQQTTVMWNGADRVTSYVSSTHLRAAITAADTVNPGWAQVLVRTAFPNSTLYSNAVVVHIYATLQITTTSLRNGTIAATYSASLTANGGATPYTWTIVSGTLPSGITLSSNGVLGGVPTATGSYPFTVQVKDAESVAQIVSVPLSLMITPAVLSITTSTLPEGSEGNTYSASLTANGGTSPYSWSLASGALPLGVSLSTAGVLSGTPTAAGTFTLAVQAKDSSATPQIATTSLSLTVMPPPLQVSTASVPSATTNAAYSAGLAATGGTQPYTWSVSTGQLPNGIGLSSSGTVSGTPTVSGTFPFTAEVRDNSGSTATANLSLVVTSGFHRWFADTSFWNTPIPTNPAIDSNSAAIVAAAVTPFIGAATFSNSDAWGISYIDATNIAAKTYTVACTEYCTGDTISFPIPAGAQPTTGSDHHLVVVNGNQELDMWLASYDATSDSWSAGVRVINDITGWGAYCPQGQHCNGAEASGFALLGGDIRPEEIQQGHIDHALAMITPYTRAAYIACPATHTDGAYNDPAAIPEGARVQLDPSFNVDAQSWPDWEKAIAKALQVYGAYIVDTGGALAVRGVTDQNLGSDSWASVNTPKAANISDLPWDQIRVLQIQSCN